MADDQTIRIHVAGRTDVGLVREHNEDSFTVVDLTGGEPVEVQEARSIDLGGHGFLLLVCDGMGGAAAGEIASALAVETVSRVMRETPELDGKTEARKTAFARRLRDAAYAANNAIFEASRSDLSKVGMGTTMTAVGVIDAHLVMAQVGDSRAYLLRDGTLTQLTRDQSLVNELLETGQITEEQAVMFEHSNVILQALGVQPDVDVLLSTVELRRGDRLVVCSDGLTGVVADEELGAMAAVSDDVTEGCRLLIEMARSAGGPDNITAIVARFDGEGLPLPADSDEKIAYKRWLLDDQPQPQPARDKATHRAMPILTVPTAAPPRDRKLDFARTFFSVTVLFALALGSLIVGTLLHRNTNAERCTIVGAPGLAVRVDGYDTGAQTRGGALELRLPLGHHRIRLQGPGAPAREQVVEVTRGVTCDARFEVAP